MPSIHLNIINDIRQSRHSTLSYITFILILIQFLRYIEKHSPIEHHDENCVYAMHAQIKEIVIKGVYTFSRLQRAVEEGRFLSILGRPDKLDVTIKTGSALWVGRK